MRKNSGKSAKRAMTYHPSARCSGSSGDWQLLVHARYSRARVSLCPSLGPSLGPSLPLALSLGSSPQVSMCLLGTFRIRLLADD